MSGTSTEEFTSYFYNCNMFLLTYMYIIFITADLSEIAKELEA